MKNSFQIIVGAACLAALLAGGPAAARAETYEDCVLAHMPQATTDYAAVWIKRACEAKAARAREAAEAALGARIFPCMYDLLQPWEKEKVSGLIGHPNQTKETMTEIGWMFLRVAGECGLRGDEIGRNAEDWGLRFGEAFAKYFVIRWAGEGGRSS